MTKNDYIFDCTADLALNTDQEQIFNETAKQLQLLKTFDKNIQGVGVARGYVLDTLLDLKPSDLDIKYIINDDSGNQCGDCVCDYIKTLVAKTTLGNHLAVDVGNVLEENHPGFTSLHSRVLSPFSHHPEYLSMFLLDENGRIWCNKDSFRDFKNREYNTRSEGLMAWIYHEKKTYYQTLAISIIRGLGYIQKRNLRIGHTFKIYLDNTEEIFRNFVLEKDYNHKGLVKYFHKKINSLESLNFLLINNEVWNADAIMSVLSSYIDDYKTI